MREALVDGLVTRDADSLTQLVAELEAAVSRPALASAAPAREVLVEADRGRGPWLGYLLRPDGSGCFLALGWHPVQEAAAVRDSLPLEFDENFRIGPIDATHGAGDRSAAVLLWVEYETASLPSEHRLLNDLQAVVMLHELIAEEVDTRR
jgi:hypothetical protein